MKNLLNELARQEIPPPPVDLSHQVHRKINSRLLLRHLIDIAFCGIPFALVHFGKAMIAAVLFSLSGKPPDDSRPKGTQS